MTTSATAAGLRSTLAILAALAMIAALLAGAVPATAETEGGAGAASGTEHIWAEEDPPIPPSVPVFCAEVDHTNWYDPDRPFEDNPVSPVPDGRGHYELDGQGTYTGLTEGSQPPAVYDTVQGGEDLEIMITATQDFWIAPEGTYTQDGCVAGGEVAGANGVEADFTIYAEDFVDNDDEEPCQGTGTFRRVNTTFVADWTLDEDCNVVGTVLGGSGVAPGDPDPEEGTWHTFEGHLTPCLPLLCDLAEEGEVQLVGTYQQTLHDGVSLP